MSLKNLQLLCVVALCLGAAALGGAALGGPTTTLTVVAVAAGLVATAVALLALRGLRGRVAVGERRWRETQAELRSLRASVTELTADADRRADAAHPRDALAPAWAAVAVLEAARRGDDALPPGTAGLLPAGLLVDAIADLADQHVLDADLVARQNGVVGALPLRTLRTLARGLRDRGYLLRAQEYFRAAAAREDARDLRSLALRTSELRVMNGEFVPVVARVEPVQAVPGRVLHVVGRAVPTTQSGYTLRTHSTARAQVAAGLDPHVYVQLGVTAADAASVDTVDGVTYHRPVGESVFTAGHEAWLQANADALLQVVTEVRPGVLHAHSDFYNALIARAVGDATGVPVVYEARGFWEESWLSRTADKYGWSDTDAVFSRYGVPEAYSWRLAREADARRAADHVVTLARVMSERIVEAGVPEDRITIVPNAVDGEAFPVLDRDEALAAELGVPPGTVVVGCVTSVVEYEGIETLVDAVARLVGDGAPIWLLVVGDGPVLPALRARAQAVGLDAVTFTGRVPHDEVLRYYSVIDVFAVPRRPATVCHLVTPLKPFEAFAAGRVVLMSDVRALREIAEDSGAAALFTAGDVTDLARVLAGLVDDPAHRARLAETGARWVRAARSWTANARSCVELYDRLEAGRA